MPKLKLTTKSDTTNIRLKLSKNGETLEEMMLENSEELIPALDNLFKKYKLKTTDLEEIQTEFEEDSSLTSIRLVKTFKKIFEFANLLRGN